MPLVWSDKGYMWKTCIAGAKIQYFAGISANDSTPRMCNNSVWLMTIGWVKNIAPWIITFPLKRMLILLSQHISLFLFDQSCEQSRVEQVIILLFCHFVRIQPIRRRSEAPAAYRHNGRSKALMLPIFTPTLAAARLITPPMAWEWKISKMCLLLTQITALVCMLYKGCAK